MDGKLPTEALKVAMQKRILNEFGAKILNEERLDKMVRGSRQERVSPHVDVTFFCECDAESCAETISLSTEEYERVHSKTKYFIVVPSHVRLDLEEIINSFTTYAQVGKFFPRRHSSLEGNDVSMSLSKSRKLGFPGMLDSRYQKFHEQLVRAEERAKKAPKAPIRATRSYVLNS